LIAFEKSLRSLSRSNSEDQPLAQPTEAVPSEKKAARRCMVLSSTLQKKWVMGLGIVVLVIGISLLASYLAPPEYSRSGSLVVSPTDAPFGFPIPDANAGDSLSFSIDDLGYFDFYVMTGANFRDMQSGLPFTYIYRRDGVFGKYSYSFTAPESNEFDFVVGKTYSPMTLTLSYSVSRMALYRIILFYVGIALSVLGIVVTPLRAPLWRTALKYWLHGFSFSILIIVPGFFLLRALGFFAKDLAPIFAFLSLGGGLIGWLIGWLIVLLLLPFQLLFLGGLNSLLTRWIWSISIDTQWITLLMHGLVLLAAYTIAAIPLFMLNIFALFFLPDEVASTVLYVSIYAFIYGFIGRNIGEHIGERV